MLSRNWWRSLLFAAFVIASHLAWADGNTFLVRAPASDKLSSELNALRLIGDGTLLGHKDGGAVIEAGNNATLAEREGLSISTSLP